MKEILITAKTRAAVVGVNKWQAKLKGGLAVEIVSDEPYIIKIIPIDPTLKAHAEKDRASKNKYYEKFLRIAISNYVRDMKQVEVEVK
jgi:hypothetical protein